jgi:hypothetical protein
MCPKNIEGIFVYICWETKRWKRYISERKEKETQREREKERERERVIYSHFHLPILCNPKHTLQSKYNFQSQSYTL